MFSFVCFSELFSETKEGRVFLTVFLFAVIFFFGNDVGVFLFLFSVSVGNATHRIAI